VTCFGVFGIVKNVDGPFMLSARSGYNTKPRTGLAK
jgi:hypothetical protein